VGIRQRPCTLDDVSAEHKALQGDGLLTVVFEGNFKRLELTEKGKQYAVGNITETPANPGVMGVRFSEMHRDGRLAYHLAPSTFAAQPVTFKKYDDGWRLQ
jgi:hypothetical protein